MLIPKRLPTSKVIVLASVVLVAVAISGYLLYYNFYSDTDLGTTVSAVIDKTVGGDDLFQQPIDLPQVSGFDEDFFADPSIRILKNYGQVPPLMPGKQDPFAPLPGTIALPTR